MTLTFQWFGLAVTAASLCIAALCIWAGHKKAGYTGVAVAVAVLTILCTLSGTYGPKLAIDSRPIQDVHREPGEIVSPESEDFEPRFEERVEGMREGVLKSPDSTLDD